MITLSQQVKGLQCFPFEPVGCVITVPGISPCSGSNCSILDESRLFSASCVSHSELDQSQTYNMTPITPLFPVAPISWLDPLLRVCLDRSDRNNSWSVFYSCGKITTLRSDQLSGICSLAEKKSHIKCAVWGLRGANMSLFGQKQVMVIRLCPGLCK